MRYDDIYRMDEIKSLSFHILLYRLFRGVAKYIVYAHTFSSFGWLRSLHAEAGGSEQEHDQPGQNEELVPKRGTTSVAWTRVLSTAVLKQPILSRWNTNNRAMCAPSLFQWGRSAHFFFAALLALNNYISTTICIRIPVFASILINTVI